MENYYVTVNRSAENTAWEKSVADVESFLDSIGFKPVSVQRCVISTETYLPEVLSPGPENKGILLIQFPRILFDGFNLKWFLGYMKKNFGSYKLVALVHDLDSIRFGDFFATDILAEVPLLNGFDYLITVNDAMLDVLKNHGAVSKLRSMSVFDYAIENNQVIRRQDSQTLSVAFAGNLKYSKSQFVYELDKLNLGQIRISLYGPYLDSDKFKPSANVIYRGEFPPEDLPGVMNEDFGLCWDGNRLDCCSGKHGEYFKYSNPHKVSLYLAMGMPVIVSEEISTAKFIKKEHAGIIIRSLYELPEILNNITKSEYQELKNNCSRLSEKLRNGYYLKQAVQSIEQDILCE